MISGAGAALRRRLGDIKRRRCQLFPHPSATHPAAHIPAVRSIVWPRMHLPLEVAAHASAAFEANFSLGGAVKMLPATRCRPAGRRIHLLTIPATCSTLCSSSSAGGRERYTRGPKLSTASSHIGASRRRVGRSERRRRGGRVAAAHMPRASTSCGAAPCSGARRANYLALCLRRLRCRRERQGGVERRVRRLAQAQP